MIYIILGLATWRVSHMFVYEEGPFKLFVRIRELFGIKHDSDNIPIAWPDNCVLTCVWCFSVWVAFILYFLPIQISIILAVSAMACFLEELYNGQSKD